ncbi:AAA family ATPase [Streptomyces sp. NBC_00190]|uniref:helix-turn-helix transcriptional regulator n=1 Tax=Streptomyces sp. NBC_00190 TaxID=2903634 RepID=UPI002E2B675C|nr:AAA family ATPase [Streptomyces sp. NBC_00190]
MLYGRGTEQDQIHRMLIRAGDGASCALVIHGEAGIGKTALLEYAAGLAGPGRVLRTVGIESEMELAFGGLHQLLWPVSNYRDQLPEPQAAALNAAFGLSGEAVRDRFSLGTAVLTTLSQAAGSGPLLCLIDDSQWLDQASLDALTFAARRLHTEGVVMLFAVRDGVPGGQITGLPQLLLHGLDPSAVDALLTDRVAALSPYTRDQIVEQAQGNPLALLELPAALTAEQRAGQLNPVTLPAGLSTPSSRIQETFREQIRRLPEPTRAMLLVAAADDSGDLDLVLRASTRFGATLEDLEPAEHATLILLTENALSFRHPLIRSATYQNGALARRLAAHRALADALDEESGVGKHADRRAWHLAAATTGADEAVAAEMVGVAQRAGGRQGTASASAAYERAAQLTADSAGRARLLAAAAFTSAEAGQFHRTAALTDHINAVALDPGMLADFARVRAIVELDRGSPGQAARILLECADRISSSADLAPVLTEAVQTAQSSGDRQLMADVAARLPDSPEYAMARAMTGPLDAVRDTMGHSQAGEGEAGFAERILAGTYDQLFADHGTALDTAIACVRDCRAQDMVGWLHTALHLLAETQLSLGLYEEARTAATEGLAVAEQFGRRHRETYLRATLATLAALQGEQERCVGLSEATLDYADAHGIELAAAHAHRALGLLDLGLGDAGNALTHLEAARSRVGHPTLAAFLLPDLVEAAIRAGQRERAAEPVALLAQWAQAAHQPTALALSRRCQAVTGPEDEAEQHFTAALHLHDAGTTQPFERARTELLYGEWLRRERRRTDARSHLRTALETFEKLGAQPWTSRARTELQASGETVDPDSRPNALLGRLSPQEREVVRLAATGATNRQIATQLFLSPRTVGHHLYRAFPKLGITTRTELPQLLRQDR